VINTINEYSINKILTTSYYGAKEAKYVADKTGSSVVVLPHDVGSMDGTEDLVELIDTIVNKLRQK
jgi:hypothetical protein